MGRVKSSLFCADCKCRLADEMIRALSEGYKFPDMLKVFIIFRTCSRPYLEGYLYGTWMIVRCHDREDAGEKHPKIQIDMNVTATELAGFKQAIQDGKHALGENIRHRFYELICYYFSLIQYSFPHHEKGLTKRLVDRVWQTLRELSKADYSTTEQALNRDTDRAGHVSTLDNELDAICRAVEAAAEKV